MDVSRHLLFLLFFMFRLLDFSVDIDQTLKFAKQPGWCGFYLLESDQASTNKVASLRNFWIFKLTNSPFSFALALSDCNLCDSSIICSAEV